MVSSVITVGNYEYAFYWYFYQDGSIEAEVRLTGIMLTAGLADGEDSPYGTRIDDGVLATYHQHFFCVRLHMAVDGPRNSVYEVDTEPCSAWPGRTRRATRSSPGARCCAPSSRRSGSPTR